MVTKLPFKGITRALSAAVIAEGKFAFVSGHTPRRGAEYVSGSIEEETALVLSNLLETIEALGGEKDAIVRCTCYLANMADFERFDATYRDFFESSFPARTTIGTQLYGDIKVEIDAIAVLG